MNKPSKEEIRARELLRDLEDARLDLKHYVAIRNRLMVALVILLMSLTYIVHWAPLGDDTRAIGIPVVIITIGVFAWLVTHTIAPFLDESNPAKTVISSRNQLRERVRFTERQLDDHNFITGAGL